MNVAPLQSGYLLSLPADHQLSCAESLPHVCETFTNGQGAAGLPGKAIDQRLCVVDRCAESDKYATEYFDADEFAASLTIDNSGDEYCEAPDRSRTPESQQVDSDGPWQVVRRRRSGRKRQQPSAVAPSEARGKNGARAKSTSASQWSENCSAMPGQKLRLQMSGTLSQYRPLCSKSFERLGAVDWASFDACQMKYQFWLQASITRDDFQRFHRMMTRGPHATWEVNDVVVLVDPFKVMLSESEVSVNTVFLSLIFEHTVPGFVKMLGARFISILFFVSLKHGELRTAITELLAQIFREDEHWMARLGWKDVAMRHRCNLFSSMAYLFKLHEKIDLIHNLHQQVGRSWMEKFHYATVQKLGQSQCNDQRDNLRDLKAGVCAIFSWLESRLYVIPKSDEQHRLIVCYACVTESVIKVVDSLGLKTTGLLLGLWQSVARWSVRFRKHLSYNLGDERATTLLQGMLQHLQRWPELEHKAFELRLTLLETVLGNCERMLLRRNRTQTSQVWCQYESMLMSTLARCEQFMSDYQPSFLLYDSSDLTTRKEQARLELLFRQSVFHRLDCEIRKRPRQRIQENLQFCQNAFSGGWALDPYHREQGVIELAKWHFLAGECDAGISSLTNTCFRLAYLGYKKANLLALHGAYQAAYAEYHRVKAMLTDQRARDGIDDRIAMTCLQLYQTDKNINHLVSAFKVSADLLRRCDIEDRGRFEGALLRIVNAIKKSDLRFESFVEQTSVLGYLVKDGCRIKSWHHLADLLYIRHKVSLTSVDSVNKMADKIGGKHGYFLGRDKRS